MMMIMLLLMTVVALLVAFKLVLVVLSQVKSVIS